MGKIMPDYKKLITTISASKTFNLAGMLFSNIIIRDEEERNRFQDRDKNIGAAILSLSQLTRRPTSTAAGGFRN